MIESWKIGREIQRFRQQLKAIPELFYEPVLRWLHDRRRAQRLQVHPGTAPASERVAVYLIYQPGGLVESSLLACRHFVDQGYAPVVVSNSPLSDEDRLRLLAVSWRVVERPNFGYDFGGYRDAIWLLRLWGQPLHSLILANDSVWFPALEDDRTIRRMEGMSADLRGILWVGAESGAALRRGRDPFLASFFLMFSQRALASEAFSDFWRAYRSTSNKYKTIRRGERGLSYAMRDAGFTAAGVFDRGAFDDFLETRPPTQLRQMLDELVTLNPRAREALRSAAQSYDSAAPEERLGLGADLLQAIRAVTGGSNILSSAPLSMLRDFRLPFIKKAADAWNSQALGRLARHLREDQATVRVPAPVAAELIARAPARRVP